MRRGYHVDLALSEAILDETLRVLRDKFSRTPEELREPNGRSEATEALRGLVDAIVLTPDQGGEALQIELRGNLAAMLGATKYLCLRGVQPADCGVFLDCRAGSCLP